jgi:hypothetical protein
VGPLPWQPTIETAANGAVSFESAGVRWRVYDGCSRPAGRIRAHAPPRVDATHRYFVRSDGERNVYAFAPRDSRALSPNLLKAQLANARLVKSGITQPGASFSGTDIEVAGCDCTARLAT